MVTKVTGSNAEQNPFLLENEDCYQSWRDQKLAYYPDSKDELIVEIKNPLALTPGEKHKINAVCSKTNMVIYQTPLKEPDKQLPRSLGLQMGLQRLDPNMLADDDGITSLELMQGKHERGYIPYSDKRLLWHTDGYYNDTTHKIRAMLLHCVHPALSGGENGLLDHEMAYLLLRDESPEHIRALMEEDVLTIPENTETKQVTRPAQTGPVFSTEGSPGTLAMRYTARTRSIEWKDNTATRDAVTALTNLLASDCKYIFHHRLEAGQGIICNNVLHNRTSFKNGETPLEKRLIYRARYYDRINNNVVQQ